ncbi:MAG: LptF/LptG family permease [Cytophagaceae bacterium]|nr:LptF/LptG family permease [Cytophagaceae bacterium]MBK9933698.1 LptF/LptG family permease [Cytophagaceae bacterium]MBL0302588.1 LptF/LptG family permease [Cytophagaceae bacterium]MBL0325414.1 LptF/LptG family permease [Cytophagaceae bacterium]
MKTIDKYLIKKFLTTYVFAVFIIVLVIIVIDFVEKNDDFIEHQAPTRAILLQYYLNLAPYWANYISPLMIFISTVFFTAKLASHTEIIAILSTGTSFRRLMLPYFTGASIVAIFSFIMVGWVLPKANKTRIAFENKYIEDKYYFSDRDIHMAVEKNVYAYLSSYDNTSKTAYDFTLEKIENRALVEKLSARRAIYVDSINKWQLYDYRIRKIGIMKDHLTFSQGSTPLDTTINMYPADFENTNNLHETMTIPQLRKQIALVNSRGAEGVEIFEIEYFQRFATPFAVIILSMMGLIVSARKSRGGVGLQIAIGFVLAFVYILFYIMSKGIAESGNMPPLLAVWLPNLVFSAIATVMYFTVPR